MTESGSRTTEAGRQIAGVGDGRTGLLEVRVSVPRLSALALPLILALSCCSPAATLDDAGLTDDTLVVGVLGGSFAAGFSWVAPDRLEAAFEDFGREVVVVNLASTGAEIVEGNPGPPFSITIGSGAGSRSGGTRSRSSGSRRSGPRHDAASTHKRSASAEASETKPTATAEEVADAKTYLTGAYPLRFDGNARIAGIMVGMQMIGLPIDYIATRNDKVEAVTLEDVRRVAGQVFRPANRTVAIIETEEGA